jgi:Glycosyl transferase 4-like domain
VQPRPATIIVAFHFAPSPEVGARRMAALARCLQQKGESVTIVSAFEGLESLTADDERWKELRGYQLIRIPVYRSGVLALLVRLKHLLRRPRTVSSAHQSIVTAAPHHPAHSGSSPTSLLRRLLFDVMYIFDDRKRWSWQAMRRMRSGLPRGAVIIASGPPIAPLVAAIATGRRLGFPVIADLRDPICPEIEQGIADHHFYGQWGRQALERHVLRRATHVTTTSPSLSSRLQARFPEVAGRISCIYNGFDRSPVPPPRDTGNRLVIVYAGALYVNRDPFPFLEAVGDLVTQVGVDMSRIEIVFAGECDRYRGISLRGWLGDRPWRDAVTVLPFLGTTELVRLYERATLLLNFAEGQVMQIPAKTFELLALGRELLMLCEPQSDTAALVRGLRGVWCVQSRDAVGLRDRLRDIYRRHVVDGVLWAPSAAEVSRYSRAAQNETFMRLIENLRGKAAEG